MLILERNHMTIHKFEHLGIPDEVTQDHTKKLNAGIALMALRRGDEITGLKSEDFERVAVLVKRLTKTAIMQEIYTEDEPVSSVLDTALTEHAIAMIEEYLKEQGV